MGIISAIAAEIANGGEGDIALELPGEALVPAPLVRPSALPKVVRVAPGAALALPGILLVVSGLVIEEVDAKLGRMVLAETLINVTNKVLAATATKRPEEGKEPGDNTSDPCADCMRRRALPQSPQRRQQLTTTQGEKISRRI